MKWIDLDDRDQNHFKEFTIRQKERNKWITTKPQQVRHIVHNIETITGHRTDLWWILTHILEQGCFFKNPGWFTVLIKSLNSLWTMVTVIMKREGNYPKRQTVLTIASVIIAVQSNNSKQQQIQTERQKTAKECFLNPGTGWEHLYSMCKPGLWTVLSSTEGKGLYFTTTEQGLWFYLI